MRYLVLPAYQDDEQTGCCLIPLTPSRIQELQRRKERYDAFKVQEPGLSEAAFGDDEQHWLSISAWSLLSAEQIDSTDLDNRNWAVVDLAETIVHDEQIQTEFRTELERLCIDGYTFSWECCMKHAGRIATQPMLWESLGYLLDLAHGTPVK